jgi:hypothetical protein
MSIFPTKILLATDGSEEAELALLTAVDLANRTDSELHVVHVGGEYHPDLPTLLKPRLFEERLRELEQEAREVLEGQVKKIEEVGGTVAEAHLRMGGQPDQKILPSSSWKNPTNSTRGSGRRISMDLSRRVSDLKTDERSEWETEVDGAAHPPATESGRRVPSAPVREVGKKKYPSLGIGWRVSAILSEHRYMGDNVGYITNHGRAL